VIISLGWGWLVAGLMATGPVGGMKGLRKPNTSLQAPFV
jgi:hypothetical protein